MSRILHSLITASASLFLASLSIAQEAVMHPMVQESIGYYSVLLPPDYDSADSEDRQYPVCVIVHGSGGGIRSGEYLVNGALGREGVIYVLPRAAHAKNDVFFNRKKPGFTAWPEHVYGKTSSVQIAEEDEVEGRVVEKLYTDFIARCVEDVRERYRTNDERVIVMGHSQGGAFSLYFALDYPEMVKAAFLYAGYYKDRLQDDSAGAILEENEIYLYFAHNEDDRAVSFEHSEALLAYLQERNIPFDHDFYPDGGHSFRDEVKENARAFVDHYAQGIN